MGLPFEFIRLNNCTPSWLLDNPDNRNRKTNMFWPPWWMLQPDLNHFKPICTTWSRCFTVEWQWLDVAHYFTRHRFSTKHQQCNTPGKANFLQWAAVLSLRWCHRGSCKVNTHRLKPQQPLGPVPYPTTFFGSKNKLLVTRWIQIIKSVHPEPQPHPFQVK